MDFRLMMKMSGNACTSKTVNCAPVINFENSEFKLWPEHFWLGGFHI